MQSTPNDALLRLSRLSRLSRLVRLYPVSCIHSGFGFGHDLPTFSGPVFTETLLQPLPSNCNFYLQRGRELGSCTADYHHIETGTRMLQDKIWFT
jgi:hypothetical protein